MAASYTFYDTNVIFEDETVFYNVLSVDSTIGKFNDNFLFTSIRDETYLDLYSLTACTSGNQYSFDLSEDGAVQSNIGCTKCEDDLFSTGFTGCQECTFWETYTTENTYKKNVIDSTCKYEKEVVDPGNNGGGNGGVLVDDRSKSSLGDGSDDSSSSTVGWILIPVIIVVLSSVITSVVLIMRGLCCTCCYSNFKGLQKYQK